MADVEIKTMTFIMACRTFFGTKPGQTLQDFAAEVRALTAEDRAEFIRMFYTVGIDATKTA
jgi:hypothetical protein